MSGRARLALAIGLLAFAIYNANLRLITEGDSMPARYLPFALWGEGSPTLDSVAAPVSTLPRGLHATRAYWLWRSPDGRLLSVYPIVTPVLLAPLYAPAVLRLRLLGWYDWRVVSLSRWMEKLAASFVAALSVALLTGLLLARLPTGRALLLGAAYAFGTSTWTISSQALWQHGMAELLLVVALACVAAAPTWRRLAVGGLACGLLAANRPPDLLLAIPLLVYLAVRDRARSWIAWGAALAALAPFAAYNLRFFGRLTGGYGAIGLAGPHPFYRHPIAEGLAGLLVSPAKGLLVFAPFFAFLVLRALPSFRSAKIDGPSGDRRLDLFAAVGLGAQLVLYAATDWRAGSSYGPRFLSDALPLFVWLLIPVVASLSRPSLRAFALTVTFAVFVQAVGAFCYPRGGSDDRFYPPGRPREPIPGAVWSFRNAPFLVELRGGLAAPELWRKGGS